MNTRIGVIVAAVVQATLCLAACGKPHYTVEYKVDGTGALSPGVDSITYVNEDGNDVEVKDASLPWRYKSEFDCGAVTFLSANCHNWKKDQESVPQGECYITSMQILVDGKERQPDPKVLGDVGTPACPMFLYD
jgi:hypothetical protein